MKLILPVAGAGTRLRPHTLHLPKCLLPVAGSTILGHILDSLSPLQASETIFITGYMADKVEDYINASYSHLKSRFVRQNNPQGLGEAIHLCTPWLDSNEPVLIVLGDTLFDADLSNLCHGKQNALCVREVEDPRRFGVAVTNANKTITRLVEKPAEFVSNLALVGIYYIQDTQALVQSLQHLIQNNIRTRGEFQLTDALQNMIEKGVAFQASPILGWLDCGKPETLLETNRLVLDKKALAPTQYPGCRLIAPCSVAPDAILKDSIIGPHVSISKGCHIENSTISDSVMDDNCHIASSTLTASILGKNVSVSQFKGTLDIGEYSIVKGS